MMGTKFILADYVLQALSEGVYDNLEDVHSAAACLPARA